MCFCILLGSHFVFLFHLLLLFRSFVLMGSRPIYFLGPTRALFSAHIPAHRPTRPRLAQLHKGPAVRFLPRRSRRMAFLFFLLCMPTCMAKATTPCKHAMSAPVSAPSGLQSRHHTSLNPSTPARDSSMVSAPALIRPPYCIEPHPRTAHLSSPLTALWPPTSSSLLLLHVATAPMRSCQHT